MRINYLLLVLLFVLLFSNIGYSQNFVLFSLPLSSQIQGSCGECQYSESKVCGVDGCSGTGTYARIVNGVCTGQPCGSNLNCGWQSGCSWSDRCGDCNTGGTTTTVPSQRQCTCDSYAGCGSGCAFIGASCGVNQIAMCNSDGTYRCENLKCGADCTNKCGQYTAGCGNPYWCEPCTTTTQTTTTTTPTPTCVNNCKAAGYTYGY